MVLCREGHPTAKPASGARQAGISARMAANAYSAEHPGHPPSATRQVGTPPPSTRPDTGVTHLSRTYRILDAVLDISCHLLHDNVRWS